MKKLGIAFVLISLAIIIYELENRVSGAVIGPINGFSWLFYFGLLLFIIGISLMIHKKTLDVIIIPTGTGNEDRVRTKKALDEYKTDGAKALLISGEVNKDKPLGESQRYGIYKDLRAHGIKPVEMKVSGGRDSLENVLDAIPKIKNAQNVGIVSYSQHLKRFQYIIQKAKEEGRIPQNMNFTYIKTRQNLKEWIYGMLGRAEDKYRLREGIDEAEKEKGSPLRRILKRMLGGD